MTLVLVLPTQVDLHRPKPEDRLAGRRVWLPDFPMLEETGETQWSGDYRATGDPFYADLEEVWYVRVAAEAEWYRRGERARSTAFRLDRVRTEGSVH